MASNGLIILKLGGSLLTDKSTPYKFKEQLLPTIVKEIKDCFKSDLVKNLIIIHGVGSFGHPPVIKYMLHKGFKNPEQLNYLSATQFDVNKLRNLITTEFLKAGVPVNLMHASSMVIGTKGIISNHNFDSLKGFLSLGMVPLIGGDMMYDTSIGFSVCGGDQLAVLISRELNARRLIFATDVDGVYTTDPKKNPEALLLDKINVNEIELFLQKMDESIKDATGKMKGKLLSIFSIKEQIKNGLEVSIISMSKEGNLKKSLEGNDFEHTKIIFK
ncbi:MAG: isopentenyl phosphate kinase [Candidatus Thorarchaeota archaeon]